MADGIRVAVPEAINSSRQWRAYRDQVVEEIRNADPPANARQFDFRKLVETIFRRS